MKSFKNGNIELINADCMDYMKTLPDNAFDLAIVDPPYGIGEDGKKNHSRGIIAKSTLYTPKQWDRSTPKQDYFEELRRVSKHQIIWGANHMMGEIKQSSPSWIIWDKENGENDFADAELAFTSHNKAARIFKYRWQGMLQGDMKNKETRIHPTQKPVKLYQWLLTKYAQNGESILDTHLGSGSSAIAAHYAGHKFVGIELDNDYYQAAIQRFNSETSQIDIFGGAA